MQELSSSVSSNVPFSFKLGSLVSLSFNVNLYAAVGEDTSRSLKTACVGDLSSEEPELKEHPPTPIKQIWQCPVCGNTHRSEFIKVRPVGQGFVAIPEEIQSSVKAEAVTVQKEGIVVTLHPVQDVTSQLMPTGKSYYLGMKDATQAQVENYSVMLRLVSSMPDVAFMVKYAIRTAVTVFRLVVAGDGTLMLQQQSDAELVRKQPALPLVEVPEQGLDMVRSLAMTSLVPFDVYDHGSAQTRLIAEYAATQDPTMPATAAPVAVNSGGGMADLFARVQASVDAAAAETAAPAATGTETAAPTRRRSTKNA